MLRSVRLFFTGAVLIGLSACQQVNSFLQDPVPSTPSADRCGRVVIDGGNAVVSFQSPSGQTVLARISDAGVQCRRVDGIFEHTVRVTLQAAQDPRRPMDRAARVTYSMNVIDGRARPVARQVVNRDLAFNRQGGVQVTDFLVHRMDQSDGIPTFTLGF